MKLHVWWVVIISLFSLAGCGEGKLATGNSNQVPASGRSGNGNGSQTEPSTTVDNPESSMMEPLSWESPSRPQASEWSKYAFQVVREEALVDLNKATDTETFCPRYDALTEDQKVNFWGALFSGIAKFESGYNPLSRMHETTMGTDPVTGKPVYSEGLLQLSYQDMQWAPYCEFDWNKDKYLSAMDPKKSILDPSKNLRCGILIMARQIRNKGKIVVSSGFYWAVLKAGGESDKIDEIAAITKTLSFCN